MLKLYYSKGSSALAAHILLEELGVVYDAIDVSIAQSEHRSEPFLAINPKGRIPVLETADGVITENPAILEYLAEAFTLDTGISQTSYEKAQARSLCAYLCATAHVAFAHRHRGDRWAGQAASLEDMRGKVSGNLKDCASYLEQSLHLDPFAFGKTYGFCDPYLFQFSRWLSGAGVEIGAYPNLSKHRDTMLQRESTQRALRIHGLNSRSC